jgi:hypothetical protein
MQQLKSTPRGLSVVISVWPADQVSDKNSLDACQSYTSQEDLYSCRSCKDGQTEREERGE